MIGFLLGVQYMKGKEISSEDPNTAASKMNQFSHTAPQSLSFDSFKLRYPTDMILFVNNNQINDPNYADNSESLFLRLDKGSSSMEIVSAPMGGGGCLYPNDPDQAGPLARYDEYETIRTDVGYWRRSLSFSPTSPDENRSIFTICSNSDEVGVFSSTTRVGGIIYKIKPGEESYISDFDEIVRGIEIIQK